MCAKSVLCAGASGSESSKSVHCALCTMQIELWMSKGAFVCLLAGKSHDLGKVEAEQIWDAYFIICQITDREFYIRTAAPECHQVIELRMFMRLGL
jgi:hypothetical protein